jgi:hypothetical protein
VRPAHVAVAPDAVIIAALVGLANVEHTARERPFLHSRCTEQSKPGFVASFQSVPQPPASSVTLMWTSTSRRPGESTAVTNRPS